MLSTLESLTNISINPSKERSSRKGCSEEDCVAEEGCNVGVLSQ